MSDFTGPDHYRHQNADLFAMACHEFGLLWKQIDRVNRKERIIELMDGTTRDMPDHWDVGTNARPSVV